MGNFPNQPKLETVRNVLFMLAAFVSAPILISCQRQIKPTIKIPVVDTAMYTVLHYDERAKLAMDWRYEGARPDTLTAAEVDDLEPLIDSAYRAYTKDPTIYLHDLLPLIQYRR